MMLVNLFKLVFLVNLITFLTISVNCQFEELAPTTTNDPSSLDLTSTSTTTTSAVRPSTIRQGRASSTPSPSSSLVSSLSPLSEPLTTLTPLSDEISTSKPNVTSTTESSEIDSENRKEEPEIELENDKISEVKPPVTEIPINKEEDKKPSGESSESTESPKDLIETKLSEDSTTTIEPEKIVPKVDESTVEHDKNSSNESLESPSSTTSTTTSTTTSSTPRPETSSLADLLNDEAAIPKDSPDSRESRANSALRNGHDSKNDEKKEEEDEESKSESGETLNKPSGPQLTGSTESLSSPDSSFDSMDDSDLENLTLPSFEVNPVVDILHENNLNETPPASQEKGFTVEGSPGSGLLIRLFQGPDRSKLPVDSRAEDIYRYLSGVVDNETSPIGRSILPHVVQLGYKVHIDNKCSKAILALSNAVKAKRSWAFQFLDSYGQRDDGFLAGTLSSLGNFDQCLQIRASDDAIPEEEEFTGKYCLAHIKPPLPEPPKDQQFSFKTPLLNYVGTELENTYLEDWGSFAHELYSNSYTMGMCIPSVCQSKDIAKILNELATPFNFTVTFNSRCTPETNYWEAQSPPEYAIFILCLLGLMVAFGTAYDLYIRKKEENCLGRLFAAFSSISNTRALLGHKKTPNASKKEKLAKERQIMAGQSLSWIHGLQFLSVCWIVIANVYQLGGLPLTYLLKNLNMNFRLQGGSLMFQFILNSWDYMAQLFFLLSGFVLCFGLLGARERKRCPTFGRFFIRTWLSYVPSMIGVILITLIVFQWSWQNGPSFSRAEKLIVEPCNQNGIANIFLFNNWLPVDQMCLPQTWFISALFQLQLIGFMVIMLIHRRPALGVTLSILLIKLGIVLPGLLTYQFNLPPTMLINNPNMKQLRDDLSIQYFATYNHLSSYFVGILLAYLIYKKPAKPIINKGLRLTIWIVLGAISLSTILITSNWNGFKEIPNLTSSIIYSALHRVMFVSFFVWLIHQFTFKQGGIIGSFLSWKAFKTLNGLSLQLYLIHLIVIWNFFLTKRDLVDYRNFELTVTSFGIILFSLFFGYLTYLLIEAPFHQITAGFIKCLFGCDLKSRLREYENETDGINSNGVVSEEKKTAPEETLCTVDGTSLGNSEVRIEISSPKEDNCHEKQAHQLTNESKNENENSIQEQVPLQDQPLSQQPQQQNQHPNGINNNGIVIRL